MKKTQVLVADFETTTIKQQDGESLESYKERVKEFHPEVYSWAIANRQDFKKYAIQDGISIFSFIETLEKINKDTTLFFHNGAGFDNHFIFPALKVMGYKQLIVASKNLSDATHYEYEDIENDDSVIFLEENRKLQAKEFDMIVNDQHKIMQLRIALPSTKRKKDGTLENRIIKIWDTNLLFPSQLKDYGKTLNKEYDTKSFTKIELSNQENQQYSRTQLYNSYEEFKNDGNEREYLHQDVIILAEFIVLMQNVIPFHKWRMTAASTTYHIWKYEFFGKQLLDLSIKEGEITKITTPRGYINYRWTKGKKTYPPRYFIDILFNRLFPTKFLNDFNIDGFESNYKFIHKAYNGGLAFANPDHAGKLNQYVIHPDINSHYPDTMKRGMFPIGIPTIGDDNDPTSIKLISLSVSKAINHDGLPFIYDFIQTNAGKHYPYTINNRDYLITDAEYDRFKTYYKGDYEAEVALSFKTISGEKFFGKFIETFYKLKSKPDVTSAEKIFAKLMLNSLYGKFGQDISRSSKINVNGKWETIDVIEDANFYLPLACFITAYARLRLVDTVGHNYKYVINGDTDAITIKVPKEIFKSSDETIHKYLKDNYNMTVHPKNLGAWDVEHKFEYMIARRAKQYMGIESNGEKCFRFAGLRLPQEEIDNLTFDEFVLGKEGFKQLRPIRLPSGLLLEEYDKRLSPVWDYKLAPDYWFKNKKDFMKYFNKKVV